MAHAPLILKESLRPWLGAGVTHFLIPEAEGAISGPVPTLPVVEPGPSARPEMAASSSARQSSPTLASSVPSEYTLPPLWLQQLERAPRRPLVVWTYLHLGHDLCAVPDSTRRDCLRTLLEPLRLGRGLSAFVPCRLPALPDAVLLPPEERGCLDFEANADAFWSILGCLSPALLVVFGLEALNAVWPGHAMRLYQQAPYRAVQVIVLPDIFVPGAIPPPGRTSSQLAAVSAYLNTVLANLPRR